MAQLYKMELFVCDLNENLSIGEIKTLIEEVALDSCSTNCICHFAKEKIGENIEWNDDIDINSIDCPTENWEKYFKQIKIDGNIINIDGFLSDTDKTYYAEPIKDGEIEGLRPLSEVVKKKILTDIRDYLVSILDEWHKRIDEPNFYEQNIGVYNHIRKELDALTEYAEKLGVEL